MLIRCLPLVGTRSYRGHAAGSCTSLNLRALGPSGGGGMRIAKRGEGTTCRTVAPDCAKLFRSMLPKRSSAGHFVFKSVRQG